MNKCFIVLSFTMLYKNDQFCNKQNEKEKIILSTKKGKQIGNEIIFYYAVFCGPFLKGKKKKITFF